MQGGLWSERITYDASNRLQYVGKAVPGSAENALVWQIECIAYHGASMRIASKTWAGGDSSQKWSWTLRATYAYS